MRVSICEPQKSIPMFCFCLMRRFERETEAWPVVVDDVDCQTNRSLGTVVCFQSMYCHRLGLAEVLCFGIYKLQLGTQRLLAHQRTITYGEVTQYFWVPDNFVWIQLLYLCWMNYSFTCLAKSKPVKQEVNRTVLFPLVVSVLCYTPTYQCDQKKIAKCL